MYLSEKKNYVNQMSTIFNEKWQSISVGDEVISEIIEVHQDDTGKTMLKDYFQVIDMQLRQVSLVTNIIPSSISLRHVVSIGSLNLKKFTNLKVKASQQSGMC